jgi:2-phosphosulfolactate phosphatase
MQWHCHDLFNRMPPGATAGGIAIVIDVLRATTTMATALAHGALRIKPMATIDDARAAAALAGPGTLLGGERGGLPIPGFDLGNSPLEYTTARVAGRSIVITTTNGTAAMHACRDARELLAGALVNRSAVASTVRRLAAAEGIHDVHLVCAGTDGVVTAEDVLAAGAILAAAADNATSDSLDPAAQAALESYRSIEGGADDRMTRLLAAFAAAPGGRNLLDLGMAADLTAAAAVDAFDVVPRLDPLDPLDPVGGWLVHRTES